MSGDAVIHVALMNPEIGPNTGNIGRLCLGIGATLHLIHPLGFNIDDKAVRRAGLDYWKHVNLVEHESAQAFWVWARTRRVFCFSTKASKSYAEIAWKPGDVLLFGPETRGLDRSVLDENGAWKIPMTGPIRSLNLANAVAVVSYAALQTLQKEIF